MPLRVLKPASNDQQEHHSYSPKWAPLASEMAEDREMCLKRHQDWDTERHATMSSRAKEARIQQLRMPQQHRCAVKAEEEKDACVRQVRLQ